MYGKQEQLHRESKVLIGKVFVLQCAAWHSGPPQKQVWAVEMSCPWIDNRAKKVEEKAIKYGPLLLELKQQHPGHEVQQCNIIIDSLGGWLKDVAETMKKLDGA